MSASPQRHRGSDRSLHRNRRDLCQPAGSARLRPHTCIEATVRYAAELGYEVTVVRDATADYSDEICRSRYHIPNYASAIVTTDELVDLISSAQSADVSTAVVLTS
jgi:hypothetical protein